MAYQGIIPLATDKKNKSQSDIKDNFTYLKTYLETDHGKVNGGLEGKHIQATLPNMTLGVSHPLQTSATEVALYATGGNLFFRPASRAAGNIDADIDFTSSTKAVLGSTTLPSGIVLNWGTITLASGAPTGAITLDKGIDTLYSFTYSANTSSVGNVENVLLSHVFSATNTIDVTRATTVDTVIFHWFATGYDTP